MTKRTFNILVGLTLTLGLLWSCHNKPKNGRTDTYSSGTMTFVSDESFSPIIEEAREVFEHTYPKATIKPIYTNELDGINMLMERKVWLTVASKRLRESQIKNLKDRKYVARCIPIAYDGLALIVNNENPDTCISIKDIKRVLVGEVTKWSEVYPNSKLGDFDVVFDNAKSSTVHFCIDSILGGKPINSPKVEAVKKSAEVINYVSSHKNAIGIIGSNWLNDARDSTNVTFKKNIRVVSVSRLDEATPMNSWKPYQFYIYNGNYPLVRTIYAICTDPRQGLPWGFCNFLQSPIGQKIFFKAGLLPARGNMAVREVVVSDN
ncbi:MAG: substrate-binding domain-containing protein [Prevotella sp.]|nr:substrate-binding domain-containing protein [Prevotella sp.]MDY4853686.1 substrate-binding domain-containing protein [Prevotella sp.]